MYWELYVVRFWSQWYDSCNYYDWSCRFFVWAHHMFLAGLSAEAAGYFSSATVIIAVPTSVKIFLGFYLCYHWFPRIKFSSLSIWICSSVLLGGVTGIILSNSTLDVAYHDTYFVVAHFHYVLSLGAVMAMLLYVATRAETILSAPHAMGKVLLLFCN